MQFQQDKRKQKQQKKIKQQKKKIKQQQRRKKQQENDKNNIDNKVQSDQEDKPEIIKQKMQNMVIDFEEDDNKIGAVDDFNFEKKKDNNLDQLLRALKKTTQAKKQKQKQKQKVQQNQSNISQAKLQIQDQQIKKIDIENNKVVKKQTFSKIFVPQSRLKIVSPTLEKKSSEQKQEDNNKQKKKNNDIEAWKFVKDAKKSWQSWNKQKQEKQQNEKKKQKTLNQIQQEDQKSLKIKKCILNNKSNQKDIKKHNKRSSKKKKQKQSQDQQSLVQKQEKKVDTKSAPAKAKKIRKSQQQNYVKLDLKKKFTDRFRGQLGRSARVKQSVKLRLKQKLKSAAKSEFIQQQNGQLYNNYVNSLSQALCLNLTLDDSQQEIENIQKVDDQQKIQNQPKSPMLNLMPLYEIPQKITKQSLTPYLNQIFQFQNFREGQFEVIKNIFEHKSTLFVAETASGKSLTYLFSSVIMEGLSIVVSPLISLMLDQLNHLPKNMPAAIISSLVNFQQRNRILNLVKQKIIKLLFITPQSLQSNDMSYHLRQFPPVNFVCIDQAHCLSQLSHNFRTSYLVLQQLVFKCFKYKNPYEKPVILCLTATANIQTIQSIQEKLKIEQTFKNKSIMNKNLFVTISRDTGDDKLKAMVNYLQHKVIRKCKGILIYCRTRFLLNKVFNYLKNSNINLQMFHSAITQKQKVQILNQFREGKIKIIATTNALGMGLDFQNLQCIIHLNMPKSIESYVQQIGRAGRRQKRAYCHLFLDHMDYYTQRNYILADQLQITHLRKILDTLKKRTIYTLKQINQDSDQKDEEKQQNQKIKQKNQDQDQNQNIKNNEQLKRKCQQMQDQNQNIQISSQINMQDQKLFMNIQQQQQKSSIEKSNLLANQNQENTSKTNRNFLPFSYMNLKNFTDDTFLTKEALLTILIKIQNMTKNKFIKVHPISYQTVKISFFKKNKDELIKNSSLFRKFIKGCKIVRGSLYVKLIKKCNQLQKDPLTLLGDLHQLSFKDGYMLKFQFLNEIYVWQYIGKLNFSDLDIKQYQNDKKLNQQINTNKVNYFTKILQQVNQLQKVSLLKLNTFYTLGFINSRNRVQSLINKNQILPSNQSLPKQNIVRDFDLYFSSQLQSFYDKLTVSQNESEEQIRQNYKENQPEIAENNKLNNENNQKQDQNKKAINISKNKQAKKNIQRVCYLPILQIQQQQYLLIRGDVYSFMKNHLVYTANLTQTIQKQKQIVLKYVDGRIITRVFLGVNDSQSSYKIYGEHSYWMKYKDRNHQDLLKVVKKAMRDYIVQESIILA